MHKFPYIYRQCENTFGYDELIERIGAHRVIFTIISINCMNNSTTIFENTNPEVFNEFLDFLDGNGFSVQYHFNNRTVYITPIKKENVK